MTNDAFMHDLLLSNLGQPRAGQEVVRLLVAPTGPNPDVEVNPRLTGEVMFHKGWPVVNTLDAIERKIAAVLKLFDPTA